MNTLVNWITQTSLKKIFCLTNSRVPEPKIFYYESGLTPKRKSYFFYNFLTVIECWVLFLQSALIFPPEAEIMSVAKSGWMPAFSFSMLDQIGSVISCLKVCITKKIKHLVLHLTSFLVKLLFFITLSIYTLYNNKMRGSEWLYSVVLSVYMIRSMCVRREHHTRSFWRFCNND